MFLIYVPFALGVVLTVAGLIFLWRFPAKTLTLSIEIWKIKLHNLSYGALAAVLGLFLVAAPILALAYFHADSFLDLITHVVPRAEASSTLPEECVHSNDESLIFESDASILDLRGYHKVPKALMNLRISPANLVNTMRLRKRLPANWTKMTYGTTSPAGLEVRGLDRDYSVRVDKSSGPHPTNVTICINISLIPVGKPFTITNEVTYWNAYNDPNSWWYETYTNKQRASELMTVAIIFPNDKPFADFHLWEGDHLTTTEAASVGGAFVRARDGRSLYWSIEASTDPASERAYKVQWIWPSKA